MRRLHALLLLSLAASLAAPTTLAQQRGSADRLAANRTAPTEPAYRNGALVLTVDSPLDERDEIRGDGLCADRLGRCTLRAAINVANELPNHQQPVVIEFKIRSGPDGAQIAPGVWRITVDYVNPDSADPSPTPLPDIKHPNITIDGLTQPGARCGDLIGGRKHDLRVVLNGRPLPRFSGDDGLGTNFSKRKKRITVRGLVIQHFPDKGIEITEGNDTKGVVECNYLGTDFTGQHDRGNDSRGVIIKGEVRNNLISGNGFVGVQVGRNTNNMTLTTISRNLIGTNADGNRPLGNGRVGIASSMNDDVVIMNNVVSANGGEHPGGGGISVGEGKGIELTNNTISGNIGPGIILTGGVSDVVFENNFIGTNAAGDDLGNERAGIYCQDATDIRIGQNGQPNTIRFNDGDGIFLASACQDISIVGNVISDNGGLAVDLAPDGVTPNDEGDTDSGANGLLNFPVITSAVNNGADATITYSIEDGLPGTTFELRFCRNDQPDPSRFGECEEPNALQTVTTDGSGNASGMLPLDTGAYPVGSWVTVNATVLNGPPPAGYGATSEFSLAVQVEDMSTPLALTITPTSPLTVPRGGQLSFSYIVANETSNPATGQSWFSAALQNGSTPAEGVITTGTLPARHQVTINYTQNVPKNAPVSNYDFCLRTGPSPNTVVGEKCFTVTVTPAVVAGGATEWSAVEVSDWLPEPMVVTASAEARDIEAASSEALPTEATLAGAYPNPFSRSATVGFALPSSQRVTLSVYDVLGREVARLVDGEVEAGRHEAVLGGATLPSGVYLIRLTAGNVVQTKRITLVR